MNYPYEGNHMKLPRMEITKDGGKEVCVKVVGVEVGVSAEGNGAKYSYK